jgi:hypothetical protein
MARLVSFATTCVLACIGLAVMSLLARRYLLVKERQAA